LAQAITIDYRPRPQSTSYHERTQRWACTVAHRRFGKTVREINELIKAAATCEKPAPRFAYIAPFHAQAKAIAWDYLKRYAYPLTAKVMESELSVELVNGSRIRLYGADNPDALRGLYLDGVVLDEYGDMRPSVWGEIIRPLLTDRQGWASFIGTPKGKNHFHEMAARARTSEDWYYQELKASETGILPAGELKDAAREMTPEQYAQEFECAFDVPALGAIYATELGAAKQEGRIGPMTDRKRIDDESLEAICASFLRQSLGGPNTDVGVARLRNLTAYNAAPEGDFAPPEVMDRSDFVDTEVADTVDGMLPQLMRIFVASEDAVEFEATKPHGEAVAKTITGYINHLFYVRNDGLNVLYDWFKDALVQKVGHVMVWAEEESEDSSCTYEGLVEEQIAMLQQDGASSTASRWWRRRLADGHGQVRRQEDRVQGGGDCAPRDAPGPERPLGLGTQRHRPRVPASQVRAGRGWHRHLGDGRGRRWPRVWRSPGGVGRDAGLGRA
jgi:hypothetical protein